MANSPRVALVVSSLIGLAACTHPTFVPGPGMSALELGPDMARCRLLAKGLTPNHYFEAHGSERFVVASTVGVSLINAIGDAIQQNENYNDCMQARGWRIVNGSTPQLRDAPIAASPQQVPSPPDAPPGVIRGLAVAPEPNAPSSGAQPYSPPSVPPRLTLGITGVAVPKSLDGTSPPGVKVLKVTPGGTAESAGIRPGDLIVMLDTSMIAAPSDIDRALAPIAPNTTIEAALWRAGCATTVQLRL